MDNLFPVSVVDNFFDSPDKVLKLVDSLKFTQSKGFHPGKRTKSLHLLKYDFYHSVICKVLSLFYDLKSNNIRYEDSSMHFEKIKPFNKKQLNHILNKGLVHQDDGVLLAGVIYLDKKPNLNSGTSIYMKTRIFWDICQRPCRLYFLYDLFFDLFRLFVCLPGRLRGFGRGTKFVNLRFAIEIFFYL